MSSLHFILLLAFAIAVRCLPKRSVDENEIFRQSVVERIKSGLNESVNPCDNFYEYTCGNWEQMHKLSNDAVQINNQALVEKEVHNIMEKLLSEPAVGNVDAEDKVKIFYSTCVDVNTINDRKSQPLLDYIDSLGGWPALNNSIKVEDIDILKLSAQTTLNGVPGLFELEVTPNPLNRDEKWMFIKALSPPKGTGRVTAFQNYLVSVFKLINVENAEEIVEELMQFVEKLANIPAKENNLANIDKLAEIYPQYNLHRYMDYIVGDHSSYVVHSLIEIDTILYIVKTDKRVLINYIFLQHILKFINHLDNRFTSAGAKSFGYNLKSAKSSECVDSAKEYMNFAASAEFMRRYFDLESRNEAENLIKQLKKQFKHSLKDLDWLDADTKEKCKGKVDSIGLTVGYPDFVLSKDKLNKFYSDLDIQQGKHFENMVNVHKFKAKKNFQSLKEKFDKNAWPLSSAPTDAGGFYDQFQVHIFVQAGLLRSPFYNKNFPKALNYGSVGQVLGHELTHAFDSKGRSYDMNGNLKNWWSKESVENFNEKTKCFIEQYSQLSLHGHKLNGKMTLGENIADNGGLQTSFKAYKNWLENATPDELKKERLPNLEMSNEQMFFVSFGQTFCENMHPEEAHSQTMSNRHALHELRVLGATSNFIEFSKAFNCPVDSPMNPEIKCKVW